MYHPTLSPVCPQVCSLYLHLHSFPADRFMNNIFSRFHIYALIYNICFSLSDFTLYNRLLGSSASLELIQICSFLWLSNVPLYTYTIFCLLTHLLTPGLLPLWLLWIMLLWTWACKYLSHYVQFLQVHSRSRIAGLYYNSIFNILRKHFSHCLCISFYIATSNARQFHFLYIL